TCKSWAHAWLNEGFATYLEALWMEEDLGREEFDYEILQFAAAYMAEPYRRAIVSNRYAYPSDLFDMHLYPKAGWVLHMLRRRLGDAIFWKAIRLYVKRHANGCVETIDLIRAFEDASGKNLASFFDQWIMSPGHAEIEGSIAWEENEKRIRASLKQVQKTDGGAPIFAVPIRIECLVEDGSLRAETFEMTAQEQSFYLRVEGKPVTVALDPELAVLATWKVTRPAEWPEASLVGPRRDGRVGARVHAVRQLAERPSYKDESVLGRVLMEDPFWGVQAEAARALAAARSPHALEILLGAVDLPHPKARRAVVEALGDFRAASAAEALAAIVRKGDASYFVEAAAASALGRTRHPGAAPVLRAAMRRQSWHDILALHAARGLAAAREEEAVDDILSLASDRRRYWSCRVGAMSALADLGAARPLLAPRIAEELSRFLEDRSYLVFTRVTNALVSLGHDSGIAALRRAAAATTDPRLVNHYLMAADDLAGQKKRGEDVERLRGDMEKLQGEAKEMREKIERLEERSKGLPATPSPDKTPGRARKRASTRPSAGKGRPSGLRKREGRS
ncbi:MAG: hypothetical protein FJY88_07270, partial [Candidatus Eisenbacteria bacterium]|nr:hypothetical protein [Candidatus Eisenbacteria bacterium]